MSPDRCGYVERRAACGLPYAPGEARCMEKPLTGTDGKPNGYSRCPGLHRCREEAQRR